MLDGMDWSILSRVVNITAISAPADHVQVKVPWRELGKGAIYGTIQLPREELLSSGPSEGIGTRLPHNPPSVTQPIYDASRPALELYI